MSTTIALSLIRNLMLTLSDHRAIDGSYNDETSFRVIIAGSRSFYDFSKLSDSCDNILEEVVKTHQIIIFSGGAMGTDYLGERYARERGYGLHVFPADWKKYGNSAGPIRNMLMADNADALICFWDGRSRGPRNIIFESNKRKLQVNIIKV